MLSIFIVIYMRSIASKNRKGFIVSEESKGTSLSNCYSIATSVDSGSMSTNEIREEYLSESIEMEQKLPNASFLKSSVMTDATWKREKGRLVRRGSGLLRFSQKSGQTIANIIFRRTTFAETSNREHDSLGSLSQSRSMFHSTKLLKSESVHDRKIS